VSLAFCYEESDKPLGVTNGSGFGDHQSYCQERGLIVMSASHLNTDGSRAGSQYTAYGGLCRMNFDAVSYPFHGNVFICWGTELHSLCSY
jgi:hypothetical protein